VRVLILHSRYLSGTASGENRVVDDEASLLTEGGHQVDVWSPSPNRAHGLRLVGTAAMAIWSTDATARVRDLIRRSKAEIVHCHNLFPELSPAVLRAASDEGVAVVVTLHNYRLLCLPATFIRDGRVCEDCLGRTPWPGVLHACYRGSTLGSAALATSLTLHTAFHTFDRVARYLAVSGFVRRKYVEAGWPENRIEVKSNFAWESPRREGPGRYFLYLGRLSSEKGVATLLAAWRRSSSRLLVVGDGPIAGALRADAPTNVEFRPTVSPADVPNLIREARAVLLPSVCYEAQPRVILEAYAAGVPVLASDLGALPEAVGPDSGVLVQPGDADAWSDAVGRLLDDRESERLGQGAWQRWRERYSPERGLTDLEDAYRRAVSSVGSP
jgi:glycosyltransferase involved in cell wall biosynthesis